MKQLLIVLLVSLPLAIFGQNTNVSEFYAKYKDHKNVLNTNLSGWVLKLAANFSDDDEDVLRRVTKLKAMIAENGDVVTRRDVKQLLRNVRKDNFEELMTIQDGNSNINILIKEKKEAITDLLVVVYGEDGFLLLSLEGWLNFSDLNNLDIDIEGGEYLKKIPERKKDVPRA